MCSSVCLYVADSRELRTNAGCLRLDVRTNLASKAWPRAAKLLNTAKMLMHKCTCNMQGIWVARGHLELDYDCACLLSGLLLCFPHQGGVPMTLTFDDFFRICMHISKVNCRPCQKLVCGMLLHRGMLLHQSESDCRPHASRWARHQSQHDCKHQSQHVCLNP